MSCPAPSSTWPGPVDARIAPLLDSSALLIIDTQVDFVDGGASPVVGTTGVLPAIARLRDAFRSAGRPVVHVIRMYQGTDVDRVRRAAIAAGTQLVAPGSIGAGVVPELRDRGAHDPDPDRLLSGEVVTVGERETVLWKPRWSAFHRTRLDAHLADMGVTTLVVAGCNFPNCPRATIYDASQHDYRVLLAADAVSGVTPVQLDELAGIGALHASASTIATELATSTR